MDLDTKYQNLPKTVTCENCNTEMTAPMHCGHPMHLENSDSGVQWVCWMGVNCGSKPFEAACASPQVKIYEKLGY